jgi:hypothetical protein
MIRKYLEDDSEILENWVTNKKLLLQFSGTDFNFPLDLIQECIALYDSKTIELFA